MAADQRFTLVLPPATQEPDLATEIGDTVGYIPTRVADWYKAKTERDVSARLRQRTTQCFRLRGFGIALTPLGLVLIVDHWRALGIVLYVVGVAVWAATMEKCDAMHAQLDRLCLTATWHTERLLGDLKGDHNLSRYAIGLAHLVRQQLGPTAWLYVERLVAHDGDATNDTVALYVLRSGQQCYLQFWAGDEPVYLPRCGADQVARRTALGQALLVGGVQVRESAPLQAFQERIKELASRQQFVELMIALLGLTAGLACIGVATLQLYLKAATRAEAIEALAIPALIGLIIVAIYYIRYRRGPRWRTVSMPPNNTVPTDQLEVLEKVQAALPPDATLATEVLRVPLIGTVICCQVERDDVVVGVASWINKRTL